MKTYNHYKIDWYGMIIYGNDSDDSVHFVNESFEVPIEKNMRNICTSNRMKTVFEINQ